MKNGYRPIGIELFAGVGGLSLGFEQAGFDVVAAVEIDPVHCAAHEYNFPNCTMICRDVSKLSGVDIRRAAGIGARPIDVVFGGPPCQGFSMIGKRGLDDPRNSLVHHFVRLVLELKPRYFVFENVPGLAVGKHKRFIEEVMKKFERNGYAVERSYRILNAADFGVPQDRRRLIILGARKGLPIPEFPEPQVRARCRQAAAADSRLPVGPSVIDAIGDLPKVERYDSLFDTDSVRGKFGKASKYAAKLRGIEHDIHNYSHPRRFDRDMLTGSTRTRHTPLSQRRFARTSFGRTEPISRFYKLDPKGICNTLRAGTGSDRGAFTAPRPIHPFQPRCITNREAARLHSYPDWFRFHVTKWHGFRQIGNSVPPLLGRAVAAQIMKVLGVKPRAPAKALYLGDERLLSLTMAEAAKRYGVSADVVGKRVRMFGRAEERYGTYA